MTAYMGVSDRNETFYYAENPDGTEGIMVVLDPSTGNYASFVGPITNPSERQVMIQDESTGNTLTFEVTAAEGDTILVDLGEQGKAALAKCKIEEVLQAMATIAQYGKDVTDPSASSSASSDASASSTASSQVVVSSDQEKAIAQMTAYMGVSEGGENFYYAESPDGTQGVMVVLNPSTNEYVSFVGPVSNPSQATVRVTDESTGNTLTFEVAAADNGGILIDLGPQGKAVLAECTPQEVLEAIAIINEKGKPVA